MNCGVCAVPPDDRADQAEAFNEIVAVKIGAKVSHVIKGFLEAILGPMKLLD